MFEVVGGSDDGVIRRCSDGDEFANTDDSTGGWLEVSRIKDTNAVTDVELS